MMDLKIHKTFFKHHPHKRKRENLIENLILIILFLLIIGSFFMWIAGSSVLSDLYDALEEMKNLEKQGLLHNPPESISSVTKREIKLVHNSKGLQNYINETNDFLLKLNIALYVFMGFFLATLVWKYYLKKKLLKKIPQD